MRKIKFRGKSKTTGEWVYGDLCHLPDTDKPIIEWTDKDYLKRCWWNVEEDTIGQYTGLYDCNGTEIYEGDIVRYAECVADAAYQTYTIAVFYDRGRFYPVSDVLDNGYADEECEYAKLCCEVIGNIHDNPNLIEDED